MARWKFVNLSITDFPHADSLSPEARKELEDYLIERTEKEIKRKRMIAKLMAHKGNEVYQSKMPAYWKELNLAKPVRVRF